MDELGVDSQELASEVVLPPYKQRGWVLEIKVTMAAGEVLGYESSADGKLNFNLHSHHGRDVRYHVQMDAPSVLGSFTAPEAHDFYAMWENKQQSPVSLKFRLVRKK